MRKEEKLQIRIISKSGLLPDYATEGAAGADIRAYLPDGPMTLQPGERRLIPTGLFVELPPGVEAQIRARSGLSLRHGLTMINGVGTVDSDYRGEWNIPMVNLGEAAYTIHSGDRIAQVVFSRYMQATFSAVQCITETERGSGGFGHTGKR